MLSDGKQLIGLGLAGFMRKMLRFFHAFCGGFGLGFETRARLARFGGFGVRGFRNLRRFHGDALALGKRIRRFITPGLGDRDLIEQAFALFFNDGGGALSRFMSSNHIIEMGFDFDKTPAGGFAALAP